MEAHVARKAPAVILAVQTERVPDLKTLPRRDFLEGTFHEKRALMEKVHKMARRGEIGTTYRLRATGRGWRVEMIRLREPGPRWVKPVLIAAGAIGVAGAGLWLAALAVQAIAAVLAALLPVLLAVGALAIVVTILSALSGGGGGSAVQNNYFK